MDVLICFVGLSTNGSLHNNEIVTKYIFLFRQSRWRFWAPVNERSLRWIQQRFSPCVQQEQSGECWVRCRLQPACRFGNTAMLFFLVILFNFHRWLQKGGHFINYENTHCFLDCFFFYASRGRVVEITKFAPNRHFNCFKRVAKWFVQNCFNGISRIGFSLRRKS